MSEAMPDVVAEIERLLAELLLSGVAPFCPPASDGDLRRAEAVTGLTWPEELRQLYRLHDGEDEDVVSGTLLGLPFLGLREMLTHWQTWDGIARGGEMEEVDENCTSVPPGCIREVYACSGWIPLADDGGGDHVGVDLDPGPSGTLGQVINFGRDEEAKYVIASSLLVFFQMIRDFLRDGRVRVAEDDGRFQFTLTGGKGDYLLAALRHLDLPYGATPTAPPSGDVMPFRAWLASLEPGWQQALARHVRGDDTAYADIQRITHLNLMRADISDTSPVARLTDLRELNLGGTRVTDLSPLASCTRLKSLYLSKSPVSDLSPLSSLAQLTQLSLNGTPVTDLRPLASLSNLRSLDLEQTASLDLETLTLLPGLRRLELGGNTFPSFAFLRRLPELETLDISRTNVPDFSDVATLTHLAQLRVWDVPANDWETLRSLTRLREVTCRFEAFQRLRIVLPQRLGVTIVGDMTPAQKAAYHAYVRAGG